MPLTVLLNRDLGQCVDINWLYMCTVAADSFHEVTIYCDSGRQLDVSMSLFGSVEKSRFIVVRTRYILLALYVHPCCNIRHNRTHPVNMLLLYIVMTPVLFYMQKYTNNNNKQTSKQNKQQPTSQRNKKNYF